MNLLEKTEIVTGEEYVYIYIYKYIYRVAQKKVNLFDLF